jgi:hypothetical protein
MSSTPSEQTPDPQPVERGTDSFGEPVADRAPTAAEELSAERAAENVDVEQVGEHFQEMAELGANVRGEGQIDNDPV